MAPRTLLALHAHPDDEALLTGGTLARAADEGHRVVLVTATDGALGLTSRRYAGELAAVRAAELRASAAILGVARVEQLGWADSGLGPQVFPDPPGQVRFVRADVDEVAAAVAELLREESVDVLLSYDINGGYGHPDHVQVHRVGRRAAELAPGVRLLEVAVSPRVARVMKPRHVRLETPAPVTHVLDTTAYLDRKRRAIRAHASQLHSDGPVPRNVDLLTRLPERVVRRSLGIERFAEPAAPLRPGEPPADAVFPVD